MGGGGIMHFTSVMLICYPVTDPNTEALRAPKHKTKIWGDSVGMKAPTLMSL